MDGHIFDGLITGLLTIGIAIGLIIAGLVWGVVSLLHHVHFAIAWVK